MPRILIVEDEPIVALNYASILEEAGYEVLGPVGTVGKGIEISSVTEASVPKEADTGVSNLVDLVAMVLIKSAGGADCSATLAH